MEYTDNEIQKILQDKYKQMLISYGGDGTLAQSWEKARKQKIGLLPIRNYGRCERHEKILQSLINGDFAVKDFQYKQTLHPLVSFCLNGNDVTSGLALAEVQVKNKDITSALRFNVFVNGKKSYDNVIADALLASTPLGSTGYWKSITRMIFRDGYGMTFIAPTVGISSVILKQTDSIKIQFVRKADILIGYDKKVLNENVNPNDEIDIMISPENISIFGYDEFMCYDCRKNRNSTILQDQFII